MVLSILARTVYVSYGGLLKDFPGALTEDLVDLWTKCADRSDHKWKVIQRLPTIESRRATMQAWS
jgi:hypothetical protein